MSPNVRQTAANAFNEAKAKEIDLIVMGSHGRTGIERILLGSVAQNVIGNPPCPVIVVPNAS